MNKLAERIRHARRRGGRRLGFGTTGDGQGASRGLLIAARGARVAGIDIAVLLDPSAINPPKGGGNGDSAGAADRSVIGGVELRPLTASGAEAAAEAGAAFIVYDPDHAEAEALLREKLDYVLRLPERPLEDSELRAVGSLRPTLVIGPTATEPLPVTTLIDLRRTALGVGAPLAVTVPADAGRDLLEILRDSGVVVLILESPSAEQVAALRARIDELPVNPRRRDDDSAPVVTGVRPEPGEDDDFDVDDD